MAYPDKKQIPLYLKPQQIKRLDRYARKLDLSRQQLMFNLISSGLADLDIMNKTGALIVGVNLRNFLSKFREADTDDGSLIASSQR